MDYITNLLIEKYCDRFSYLKLYEVIFNKYENLCTIFFLYPETIKEISNQDKEEIKTFVKEKLSISANVDVKFKKSFLDDSLIVAALKDFLKRNYISIFSYLQEDKILISKKLNYIEIEIPLEKSLLDFSKKNSLNEILKNEMEKKFCAYFSVSLSLDNEAKIDESIMEKMENIILSKSAKNFVSVPRYEIVLGMNVFGREFSPYPEYIRNNNKEKNSVILAGEISSFEKKSYIPKKNKNKDVEKHKYFYSFTLSDVDSKIDVKYFATKANIPHMDKLQDGNKVAILGDIRSFNGKNSLHINSIFHCEYDEERKEFKTESLKVDSYNVVFPEIYESKTQEYIFSKKPKYSDLVKNNDIVVYDLETTGFSFENDQIIEIGAVKIRDGEMIETFSSLVKPTVSIPSIITEITHITNDMVKNSPNIETVLHDFLLFIKGCVISGYNNILFDDRFIAFNAKKYGLNFDNESVDTMALAKQKLRLNNYKLATVTKRLDIKLIDAHRALNDTIATAKAFLILNQID